MHPELHFVRIPLLGTQEGWWLNSLPTAPSLREINFVISLRIPPTNIEQVRRALERTYRHVDALRIHFSRLDEQPAQYLHDPDPALLSIVHTADAAFSAELDRLRDTMFDHTQPFPYQLVVGVDSRELVRQLGLVIPHILIDLDGLALLKNVLELQLMGRHVSEEKSSVLELQRYEANLTDESIARGEEFYEIAYGGFPNTIFGHVPGAAEYRETIFRETLISPTIGATISRAARAIRVSPSAYLMAALSKVLAESTGARRVGMTTRVSNRLLERKHSIANVFGRVPVCISMESDNDIARIAREVHGATLHGMVHGALAASRVELAKHRVSLNRGLHIRHEVEVNFIGLCPTEGSGADIRRHDEAESEFGSMIVTLVCANEQGKSIIELNVSGRAYGRAAAEGLMTSLIDILSGTEEAGHAPAAPVHLDWITSALSSVSIPNLKRAYASIGGVTAAEVATTEGTLELRATGVISNTSFMVRLAELCTLDPSVIPPDQVSYTRDASEAVQTEGIAQSNAARSALAQALGRPIASVDWDRDLLANGVEFMKLGQIVSVLRDVGYRAWPGDFLHGRSLGAVAAAVALARLER
ncbi:MAG: Condensation domain [Microbacteriaceae bacterium]|nr:Condensation domain [Microbacteriaceae bacterium]